MFAACFRFVVPAGADWDALRNLMKERAKHFHRLSQACGQRRFSLTRSAGRSAVTMCGRPADFGVAAVAKRK